MKQFIWKQRHIVFSILFVTVLVLIWHYYISQIEPIPNSLGLIQEFTALKYELYRDLLAAILAIIGIASFGIIVIMRQDFDSQLDRRIKRLESLLKVKIGLYRTTEREKRHLTEINDILLKDTIPNPMPFWLKDDIDFAKKILEETKNLDPELDKSSILLAKNNLAYNLLISRTEEYVARKLAHEIYEEVQTKPTNHHSLHTYAWILLRYAKTPKEKQNASRVFLDELYVQRNQILDVEFLAKIEKHKQIFEIASSNTPPQSTST
ncbi:MAG: hypothetical protein Q8P39_03500 [Candidatus Yanofskybacteria bacterium]|nr:hypothetical protein [Candidatus Yanofskybacteria bacterium]